MKRTAAKRPDKIKTAAGISVFLLEELGDARMRCVQLKKYIDEATSLIEKSEHRDHFFEVAAHLIHGIPECLLKMDKALDAAALAAARLDYEEIKDNLKPEKVEELERALADVRIRHVKRRSDEKSAASPFGEDPLGEGEGFLKEGPPPAAIGGEVSETAAKLTPKYDRRAVERWMTQNLRHHIDRSTDEANTTSLAEAAADQFNVYEDNHQYKIPDEIFDLALNVAEKEGFGVRMARKEEEEDFMNTKLAAAHLSKIAETVEATGQIPLPHLLHVIKSLETGVRPKTASTVDPKKVADHFRSIAAQITREAAAGQNPSRQKLAQHLRRFYAEEMQTSQAQVAAAIYQQAGSREDVMKGFKESNPTMSDEDLEKAADQWEKNKDVVKDKHQA
jgi:hypothetical protein